MKQTKKNLISFSVFVFLLLISFLVNYSLAESVSNSIFSGVHIYSLVLSFLLCCMATVLLYFFLSQKENNKALNQNFNNLTDEYAEMFNSIENGIMILDQNGNVINVNPATLIFFNYSREEIFKLNIKNLLSETQYKSFNKCQNLLLAKKSNVEIIKFDFNYSSDNNLILEFKIRIDSKEKHQVKFIIIINDITSISRLTTSLNYQQDFIENNPMLSIQKFDKMGKITQWNNNAEILYGYSGSEILGKTIFDLLLNEKNKEEFSNAINDIYKSHKNSVPKEWEIRSKDGKRKWVYSYMFPLTSGNRVSEIFCIDVDITKLKTTEIALKKSEESYRSLFENSLDGIFRTTYDGKFLDANPALIKMLGYSSKEELMKVDIPTQLYFSPMDREKTYEAKMRGLNTYKLRTKNGKEIWVEETIRKIVTENNIVIFEGIVRDVSSRQEAIDERENLYREIEIQKNIFEYIVEFAPFGVLIVYADSGKVYHHNISLHKIFGIIDNSFFSDYILWKDSNFSDEMISLFNHLKATGEIIYLPEYTWDPRVYSTDENILKKVQKSATIRTIAYPMYEASGKVTHFVIIEEDVTNQRNLEAQVRHAVKMESIGNLAGGIAHDFNNLLTGIIGNIALALAKLENNHNTYNYLINVEKAAKRAADLTSRLLSFSRKTKIALKPINLNNCIDETLRILKRTFDPKIKFETKKDSSIWPINADTGQIIQIIMNLCINAKDAIESAFRDERLLNKLHKITIEATNLSLSKEYCDTHFEGIPGDFVCLKITDTGCGMSKKTIEKIFEPFFTTKPDGEGTGLGLSIVYAIVKQHNGWINVYSEPDMGTSFKIYIPRILEAIENVEIQQSFKIRGGTETILIVDDEELIRDLGSTVLQEYGYKTLIANDGKEAMDMYRKYQKEINLVLLDYAMPMMNGAEVLEEIKKLKPEQKIILLSGYIVDSQVISAIKDLLNAFIQKPFQPTTLIQTVRNVLDNLN